MEAVDGAAAIEDEPVAPEPESRATDRPVE
jgi:hypothetical protein